MTRSNIAVAATAIATVVLLAFGWLWLSAPGHAGAVFTGKTPGVAINGYDPVAYFAQGAPVEGSAEHAYDWRGVAWHFSTPANREAFASDPERYAPQYGGYCAFAAARDSLAKTEPDAFTVHDGKLYLNYDRPIKARWDSGRDAFIESADANWPGLREKAQAR